MKVLNTIVPTLVLFMAMVVTPALAKDYTHNETGVSSYDTVAYFTEGKARRGSGFHVTEYQGVTYAFVSEDNKELFLANPEKYLPAYGGVVCLWHGDRKEICDRSGSMENCRRETLPELG